MLITSPAAITAQIEAVPASVTTASWAAPPKIVGPAAHPIAAGISPSVIASPSTNPNGIAGTNSGTASAIARRSICPTTMAGEGTHRQRDRYAPDVDLTGAWRATPATDDLRRDAIGLDVDDGDWPEIRVPGHWRDHPEFADSDGPLLYRHTFTMPEPATGRRRWITLDGIFYQADVWLDGAYLGDPEGYFSPHTFDVTAATTPSTDWRCLKGCAIDWHNA